MSSLRDKYVIVHADEAFNTIVFVCKVGCYECLIKELGISKNYCSPTFENTSFDKEVTLANHKSFVSSLNIPINEGNAYLSSRVRVTRSSVFYVVLCRSLFVNLPFLFWPLCCLPFSDLRLLFTLWDFYLFLGLLVENLFM